MNPNENTYPAQEPAAAGEAVGPTYELGQIVDFSIYPRDAEDSPLKGAGAIIGPDPINRGQMILQEGTAPHDQECGVIAGRRFSVWHAGRYGLVCGVSAPTAKDGQLAEQYGKGEQLTPAAAEAADEQAKTAGEPAGLEATPLENVPVRKPLAIVHRGPHTAAVLDLLVAMFGDANGAKIYDCPVPQPDGTVLYAVTAAEADVPAIGAAIENHPQAKHSLALVEPTPEQLDRLADANLERRWPVLVAPEL